MLSMWGVEVVQGKSTFRVFDREEEAEQFKADSERAVGVLAYIWRL